MRLPSFVEVVVLILRVLRLALDPLKRIVLASGIGIRLQLVVSSSALARLHLVAVKLLHVAQVVVLVDQFIVHQLELEELVAVVVWINGPV